MMLRCEVCEANAVTVRDHEEKFVYGSGHDRVLLSAVVPVYECGQCGEMYTGHEAEELRHEAVCRHLGRLTPREIKMTRILTQKAGYRLAVTTWQNDADDFQTKYETYATREELDRVIMLCKLFASRNDRVPGIGNHTNGEYYDVLHGVQNFVEAYPDVLGISLEEIERLLDDDTLKDYAVFYTIMSHFPKNLGLLGNDDYFITRVLDKLEVVYFAEDVYAEVIEEFSRR